MTVTRTIINTGHILCKIAIAKNTLEHKVNNSKTQAELTKSEFLVVKYKKTLAETKKLTVLAFSFTIE